MVMTLLCVLDGQKGETPNSSRAAEQQPSHPSSIAFIPPLQHPSPALQVCSRGIRRQLRHILVASLQNRQSSLVSPSVSASPIAPRPRHRSPASPIVTRPRPRSPASLAAVLSRRWEDLWTRVSILDLDSRVVYESLNEEEELEPASEAVLERRESEFCRFVDKVLGQHKNLNSLTHFIAV
ncbi:unnamed protein product [Linum trigynum]|uniref:Uncharacterized protein n=1 Tax=Linum trigynum TaxID=586398 RepID=A0AAV2D806_9ROSI